jgi:hypothetical protein
VTQLVILDGEAVTALRDTRHGRHGEVVSQLQVIALRKRRAASINAVVPTSVRVESGWDRRSPAWAFANGLRIVDAGLDNAAANLAATIRVTSHVSVADAHIGAVIQATPAQQITVLTSDPDDIRMVAGAKPVKSSHCDLTSRLRDINYDSN